MQQNVGQTEKVVRSVLGLGLLGLVFLLEGYLRWIGLIGIVLLVTAMAGWCPISSVLGVNTHVSKSKK